MKAICVLRNDKEVFGTIRFTQGAEGAATSVEVSLVLLGLRSFETHVNLICQNRGWCNVGAAP